MRATKLILLLVILSFLGWSCCNNKKKERIKVGVILPLTGDLANFGKTVLNGIELAVKDFNDVNNKPKIDLIIEDSKGVPSNAVSSINKLVDVDKVKYVIGSLTSGETMAINPIAQKKKVLLISPTASNPSLSNSGRYFFRVYPSDSFDGVIAADYCYKKLGLKKIAIVFLQNDYCEGLKRFFVNEFTKNNGVIVGEEAYMQNVREFKTILSKYKGKVDGFYIPGHPESIANILKQSKELGIQTTFFSNVASEDKEFIKNAGASANGLYFSTPTIPKDSTCLYGFINNYRTIYKDKIDIHSVKGYEAMSLLTNCFKNKISDPDSISNYIIKTKTFVFLCEPLTFEKGDVFTNYLVKMYKNEQIVILDEIKYK